MESEIFYAITNWLGTFYRSEPFAFIKLLLGIYAFVLIVDLALLLALRGTGSDIRTLIKGINMPATSKNKMQKEWQSIKKRLETENVSQFKVAILEADIMTDKILAKMGFAGKNLTERLENIQPGQLVNYEDLKKAHATRNAIIHEKNYAIDRQRAEETLAVYEKVLRYFELI